MITSWWDFGAILISASLINGFYLLISGYIMLIRHALRCPNNMQVVRAIFKERPEYPGLDPRGPNRIYAGTKQILFSVLCFIVVMIEFVVTGNAICGYRG